MEKTTDLDKLRRGKPFTWGKVVKIHEVGENYTIVEYLSTFTGEVGKRKFHCYNNNKDDSISSNSFDGALLTCMSRARLEVNTARYMAMAAIKLFEISED